MRLGRIILRLILILALIAYALGFSFRSGHSEGSGGAVMPTPAATSEMPAAQEEASGGD